MDTARVKTVKIELFSLSFHVVIQSKYGLFLNSHVSDSINQLIKSALKLLLPPLRWWDDFK